MKKGKKRISICHGWTRNFTEGTEAETRKKTEAAEALATDERKEQEKPFATEGHGISRKEEQAWNSAYAKLTIAG